MSLFSRMRGKRAVPAVAEVEKRSMIQRVQAPEFFSILAGRGGDVDGPVTIDAALGVPAISCAVGFLSRTLAALPFKVFERQEDGGRLAVSDHPLSALMSRGANDEMSAFDFRRRFWQDIFLPGRGVAFIERNGRGEIINLWPLETSKLSLQLDNQRLTYLYSDGGRPIRYAASDVFDLSFMLGTTRLTARGPIAMNADVIGKAIAETKYGRRFYANGGIPPFAITGPIKSAAGISRAAEDLTQAVQDVADRNGNALALPEGHDIKGLGVDPEKAQAIEAQRFSVEQAARIYSIPPVFLQDLTHGTFTNTEQQDLQLVKHLISQWATALEAEINLKIFGRDVGVLYCEHVLDGLMRGDFKSRSDALGNKVSTGQLTPNEARELENRPAMDGGDKLIVQGAMAPLDGLQQVGPKPSTQD